MIRNIIFDWSGTLVDDLPAVLEATNFVFEREGVKAMSLDTFRSEFCLPFKGFYERFLPGVPVAALERAFHGHFGKVQKAVVEVPRAREFLEFCREHEIRTFVLSTIFKDYFKAQSALNGFDKFIDRAYVEVWDKRAKIAELLSENQLAASETVFVGDMQHDIETAKYGGIISCAVLTGYNRLDQLRASEPDLIVEHLGEFKEILTRCKFDLRHRRHGVEIDQPAHPICTVGAAVFNSAGRVLMVRTQKWSGLWGIPGGKVKFGETLVEALRREIKEETNLEIQETQLVLAQDCIHSKEFYREAHFILLNYRCRADAADDVKLNDEAQEFKWVTLEEALQMKINQPTRVLLEELKK